MTSSIPRCVLIKRMSEQTVTFTTGRPSDTKHTNWWIMTEWQSDIQCASVLQPSVMMKSNIIITICLIGDVICCPETLSALSFPRSSQQQMFSFKPNNRADICIYRTSSGRLVRRWIDYDWLLSCGEWVGLNERSFSFSDVSMLVNGIYSVTHFSFYSVICFVLFSRLKEISIHSFRLRDGSTHRAHRWCRSFSVHLLFAG